MKKVPKPQLKWYVIKARAGQAKALRREILRQVKIQFLEDYFGKVVIPRKRQLVLKKSVKGERRVEERKMRFGRGYLLIQVALVKWEVWRLVNSTLYSLGLMPEKTNPTPLDDDLVRVLIAEEKAERKENVKVKTGLKVGDKVEVLEGMFQDMEGEVTLVQGDGTNEPRIKVTLSILGRPVFQEYKHYQVSHAKGR